jgi:hypothetical protein
MAKVTSGWIPIGILMSFLLPSQTSYPLHAAEARPAPTERPFVFVHPGLLHDRLDLERMKNAVASKSEPTFAGYETFCRRPASQSSYTLRGSFAEIGRNPNVNFIPFDQDATAAYHCAIQWGITGDAAYAEKSKSILNGWSATLRQCTGADAVLMAGLGPFKLINAAEILRYTNAGWNESDVRQCEKMFRDVIYPVVKDFALFANGNWDAAALQMVMAIGVFCDDRAIFERALRYYVDGAGDGALSHYLINDLGQCQESGRDQAHTQLGLGLLSDCCEIAWHQGLDLYAYAGYRLLRGFEYTAQYNLGEDVPFAPTLDQTGHYAHRLISRRGNLRPIYEQVFNHYVHRAGVPAPWTQKAAERLRPEGATQSADHPGFGTLLFTRPLGNKNEGRSLIPPAAPGALVAHSTGQSITLAWAAPIGTTGNRVKRAEHNGGPFTTIAPALDAAYFVDSKVDSGKVYYYTVSARNAAGESPDALETSLAAGLPDSWMQQDLGAAIVAGRTQFDGRRFILEGAGTDIGHTNDQGHFMYAPFHGNGRLTARFVPPVSSQFSQLGLMMRATLRGSSAQVSLLIGPCVGKRGAGRSPWQVQLVTRSTDGTEATLAASSALSAPMVAYGRLMQPCWLRLERSGLVFSGSVSDDGQSWTSVGTVTNALANEAVAGLTACSRLTTVATTVCFDAVSIRQE